MEDIQEKKRDLRNHIAKILGAISDKDLTEYTRKIENRLFEFANFLEAKITLLYIHHNSEVNTREIIKRSFDYHKIVVLPAFNPEKFEMKLFKVDNLDADLILGERGIQEPHPSRCKNISIDVIDIAIIPGVSRSGLTISAGTVTGVKRQKAAEFAFLLSIPAILDE